MTINIPSVSRLFIYPIKSWDRVEVDVVNILASGALQGDRQFAIFDTKGNFVNGKRNQRIHALRAQFDLVTRQVSVSTNEQNQISIFNLDRQSELLTTWLTDYFGFPVEMKQNLEMGFPDDTASPGPTIISTATLEEIASWYPELDVEEIRARFRANIEISNVPAFWEDRLFTQATATVEFEIGNVRFSGVNPCQRCVVVTRDSQTGIPLTNFQKIFVQKRKETLPNWVEKTRFNHFYRLAINTKIPASEAGKTIQIGDRVQILSSTDE